MTTPYNIEVSGCGLCPFTCANHNLCKHPGSGEPIGKEFDWYFYGNDEESPEWCPLKKKDALVSFKKCKQNAEVE